MIIVSVVYIIIGFYFGTNIKITNIPIETNRISRDYKLVFISDLHVDISRNTKFIQKIVDKIKEVKPDFVFIGGDLMNM
jgi:predicted MPP superfamily phosphohydrolase